MAQVLYTGHSQAAYCGGHTSPCRLMTCGVSQGLVLGAPLFLHLHTTT